ncbi:MAG: hypothetical protein MHMPM18_004326, partial [Marteilia pararefringens]
MLLNNEFASSANLQTLGIIIFSISCLKACNCKVITCGILSRYKHRGNRYSERYEKLCGLMRQRFDAQRKTSDFKLWFKFEIQEKQLEIFELALK